MMVAAVIGVRQLALAIDRAAEFAAPDHQRVVQQAALLQVLDQRRRGLVDALALQARDRAADRCAGPSRDGRAE